MIGELLGNRAMFEHPLYNDPSCCHSVDPSQFLKLRVNRISIRIIPVSLHYGVLLVSLTMSIEISFVNIKRSFCCDYCNSIFTL